MTFNYPVKPNIYALVLSLGIASPLAIAAGSNTASTAASNATTVKLAQVKGRVMVNNGAVYTQASSGALLQTGAKLVTPRGASAVLVYKDGCTKKVAENSMVTIGSSAECSSNAFKEKVLVAAAVGDTVTDTPAPLLNKSDNSDTNDAILGWTAGLLGLTAVSVIVPISSE